jgi:predicted transcriptional regulator
MKLTKSELNLLGLGEKELTLFNALEKKSSSLVTDLASEINLPRTTIAFLLKKLKKRGFVEQVKINKHKEWRLKPPKEIKDKLRRLSWRFDKTSHVLADITDKDLTLTVFTGFKNIKKAYRQILSAGKNNRVFFIQGNLSTKVTLEKIDWSYINNLHKDLRQADIVMEGLISQEVFDLFNIMSVSQIKSHLGRLIVLYIVPDQYLDLDLDIIFFADKLYFIDVIAEKIIFIKNESMVKVFKNLFYLAESFGKKVNLDEHLKKLIKEKTLNS